ncbi:MAG TPA: hypothetical protein VNE21_02050 [Mycobacteriales bacterium]|nr:hypothetical protein [Mycobacteriales bacterium]
MSERITLTDLDVISRFSLAVRSATADRDEVIEALEADLAWLRSAAKPVRGAGTPARSAAAAPRVSARGTARAPGGRAGRGR